ncbi:MAG: AbrB/MazE/SpoVT family DNA-binding domain-containing protein [Gammaproteobacteria bacterium]|nr:AbrB/MazE/SpoVT family DNA-binding domain-containing protein [Gammaproteobacteria bacterium]
MTVIAIRRSGGANIVSLPKTILKMLNLHEGSLLVLTLEDRKITLTPAEEKLTLEKVLKGSPQKRLTLNDEDKEWFDSSSVGKEL